MDLNASNLGQNFLMTPTELQETTLRTQGGDLRALALIWTRNFPSVPSCVKWDHKQISVTGELGKP